MQQIKTITNAMADIFPQTDTIKDEDYRRIIRLISKEHNDYRMVTNRKYADMIEYYTTWAHQIKTPIASMRLHLQNEDTPLSCKLTSDLHRIEQYVEMVLTFLRLNSESTDYVFKEYDLDKVVKSAVKKFSSDFIGRKLSLVYEPLNTTVVTDEKWMSFVIEQVLSNALKYTPSGSIAITLEDEKTLRIRDTGIGIAPEDLPRIFENGYTGYNGRTDHKSSGIGLYLCKRICSNLGHRITVSSIVDVGTTVDIDLTQRKLEIE
ncbi:MAG: sensor histidine kinase [Ruminococcus sp.]